MRVRPMTYAVVAVIALCVAQRDADAQRDRAVDVRGCWQLSRPAGPVGTDKPLEREERFNVIWLRDSGDVRLPKLLTRESEMWSSGSVWVVDGAALDVRVSTGLQGWQLQMTRADKTTWSGTATYLSDAIVVGQAPRQVPITATRMECDDEWVRSAPAPQWRQTVRPIFEFQADQPVRLTSALPRDVAEFRNLGRDDTSSSSEEFVVQMIVDANGAPQLRTIKVFDSSRKDVAALHPKVQRVLRQMRFAPAIREERPVAVLSSWLLRWR